MSKILMFGLGLIVLIVGGYLVITTWLKNSQPDDQKPITLTIWGLKDDGEIITNVAQGFKKLHPNVTINYVPQTPLNYRTRVQTQVSSNQGPDILAIHNSWTPMFLNAQTLSPAPAEILDSGSFGRLFYKVAADSFVVGGKVYGIPSEIDGLALFYNEDILKAQNLSVPKIWDNVVQDAAKTTVLNSAGLVATGGLGMGNTTNVDNWSEILGLLLLQQPETEISQPSSAGGKEVVSFFKNPTQDLNKKVWDERMAPTTQAFAQGNLTFYLGPAYKAREIKQKNPNLHFGVIPVPQLPDKTVNLACFWGYGVSSKSKNQPMAWQFLKFLTDKATEQYIFEQETQKFGLGRPYARTDLQEELIKDKVLGPFVAQGPIYKTFPLCWDTMDAGLNDEMIKAFKDGVDSGDLTTLQNNIPVILNKFSTTVK